MSGSENLYGFHGKMYRKCKNTLNFLVNIGKLSLFGLKLENSPSSGY